MEAYEGALTEEGNHTKLIHYADIKKAQESKNAFFIKFKSKNMRKSVAIYINRHATMSKEASLFLSDLVRAIRSKTPYKVEIKTNNDSVGTN